MTSEEQANTIQRELADVILGKAITSMAVVDGGRAVHLRVAGSSNVLELRSPTPVEISDVTSYYHP